MTLAAFQVQSRVRRSALVFCAYLILAFLLHGAGHNIWRDLLGGGDGYTAGLPSKLFSRSLSAWNPFVQLGQFTFANTQFQPFYPPGLIVMRLFPNTFGYNLFILGHYAMAGLFFYWFARNLKLLQYAAFLGGLIFMCCGFLAGHKGHQALMSTAVWLPLMLLFADRFGASNRLQDAVLGGGALAMSILGGFPQVTVYGLMIVIPYFAYRCTFLPAHQRRVRIKIAAAGLLTFFVSGFLLSSLQLFSVAEALPFMTRQKISLQLFSEDPLPAFHLLGFLLPNFLGGFHGVNTYSSNPNIVEMYGYSGLVTLALALLAVWCLWRKVPDVRFWTVVGLIATILALGLSAVQEILYYVPVYNLFRAPTRHLYEMDFALAVLATFGADRLSSFHQAAREHSGRAVQQTCLVFGLLFVSVVLMSQAVRNNPALLASSKVARLETIQPDVLSNPAARQALIDNLAFSHRTVLYPVVFFLCTVVLIVTAARKRSQAVALTLLPAALLGDIWSVYHTIYDNPDTTSLYGADRRSETAYLNARMDRTHFRIYPADPSLTHTYPLLNMMYGVSTINDYTPMWLKPYQRVTGFALNGAAAPDLVTQQKLLSILGAQYILAREPSTVDRIRMTPESREIPVSGLPVPPMTCLDLNCILTTFPDSRTLSLKSPDGQAVSVVHIPVRLRKSTYYQIQFEARGTGEQEMPLVVDLYSTPAGAPVYDSPNQDRLVWAGGHTFRKYTLLIDSGPFAPSDAMLRLYTQSPEAVEVRNISLGAAQATPATAYIEEARTHDGISIFRNPKALPRFRFVSELLPAKNVEAARATLLGDGPFDPTRQAIVEGLAEQMTTDAGRITKEWTSDNYMKWQVETGSRSFLVVGDSWFPGWRAKVDGHDTEVRIVNGFLRGLFISKAGTHTVEMSFWPRSLTYALCTTIGGVLLVVFSLLFRNRDSA